MGLTGIINPGSKAGSGVFPTLVFVQGNEQRTINLDHSPFTVGRKVDKDLVIADPRVSRDHAVIVSENGRFFVVDRAASTGPTSTVNVWNAKLWKAMTGWNLAFVKPFTSCLIRCMRLRTPRAIS